MGYVFHPDGKLDSVTWTSFELHEHGEDGNPPKEFTAKFSAGMKKCLVFFLLTFTAKLVEMGADVINV